MKKYMKKGIAVLLSAAAAVSSVQMSAGAMALIGTSLNVPNGYTELDDHGYFRDTLGSASSAYTVFTNGNAENPDLIFYSRYCFNYTRFSVTDMDTFASVYAAYQDALDFDCYGDDNSGVDTASRKTFSVFLYDEKDADGNDSKDAGDFTNKKDAVLRFARALSDAGILVSAEYMPVVVTGCQGNYTGKILLKNVDKEKLSEIQETAKTVDSDAEVTYSADTGYLTVEGVEVVSDGIALADQLQKAYPDAEITLSRLMAEDAAQVSSADIDLTTAYYTGDVDNNSAVDARDAAAVLTYAAKQGAGMDGTLSGGEAPAEAAAFAAADVNGDGVINAADAAMILQYSAQEGAGMASDWA